MLLLFLQMDGYFSKQSIDSIVIFLFISMHNRCLVDSNLCANICMRNFLSYLSSNAL
jgi:hypothetical protein